MEVRIRLGREDDYESVESIMKQVHHLHAEWRPDIYKKVDTVLPRDIFLNHLERKELLVAVTEEDRVAGLLIYLTRNISGGPMRERKIMFIDSMAVDEQKRGKGIGHTLFNYAVKLCKNQKYDGLELQVNAKNRAAKAMYESYGFTEKSINMELK